MLRLEGKISACISGGVLQQKLWHLAGFQELTLEVACNIVFECDWDNNGSVKLEGRGFGSIDMEFRRVQWLNFGSLFGIIDELNCMF